jgi:hypothetical protein
MIAMLEVIHTQSADRRALVTLRNLPGRDAELTPAQLRALAGALLQAAQACERRPMGRRHFACMTVCYPLAPVQEVAS